LHRFCCSKLSVKDTLAIFPHVFVLRLAFRFLFIATLQQIPVTQQLFAIIHFATAKLATLVSSCSFILVQL